MYSQVQTQPCSHRADEVGIFSGEEALEEAKKKKKKVLTETGGSLKIHVIDTAFQTEAFCPITQDFNHTVGSAYKELVGN